MSLKYNDTCVGLSKISHTLVFQITDKVKCLGTTTVFDVCLVKANRQFVQYIL